MMDSVKIYKPLATIIVIALMVFTHSTTYGQNQKKIDSLKQILSQHTTDSIRVNALFWLSTAFYPKQLDSALFYANRLKAFSEQINDDLGRAKALKLIGNVHIVKGDHEQSTKHYKQGLNIMKQLDIDLNTLVAMAINLAISYTQSKEYQNGIKILDPLLAYTEKDRLNQRNKARIFRYLGHCYLGLEDKEKALSYYTMCVNIYSDPDEMLHAYNETAVFLLNSGDYVHTIKFLLKALELTTQPGLSYERELKLYRILGSLYLRIEQMEKAITYLKKGEQIAQENQLYETQILYLFWIGDALRVRKNYDQSRKALFEALAIGRQEGIDKQTLKILEAIGYSYYNQEDYESAIIYFQKRLKLAKEKNNSYQMAHSYCSLGESYFESKQYDKSETMFKRAKKIFEVQKKSLNKVEQAQTYLTLYVLDTMQQNYTRSTFENHNKYIAIRNSLATKDQIEKVKAIETAYEAEKKDKEISLLTIENDLHKTNAARQRNLKTSLAIGVVLLFLLVLLAY